EGGLVPPPFTGEGDHAKRGRLRFQLRRAKQGYLAAAKPKAKPGGRGGRAAAPLPACGGTPPARAGGEPHPLAVCQNRAGVWANVCAGAEILRPRSGADRV